MPDDDKGVDDEQGNPVKSSSKDKDDDLKKFFPSFIWALRDFTLKTQISGKQVTPDEYLEYALSSNTPKALDQEKGLDASNKKTTRKTHPKDSIKEYFPQRKCFIFPIPVKDTDMMESIDTLTDSEFSNRFVETAREFCEFVFSESKVKTVFDDITTGRALARLAAIYVESIRNGNAPCIQNAVESTAKLENEQAIKESVDNYKKQFNESVKFPTKTVKEMCDCHAKCSKEAYNFFLRKSVFDSNRVYYKQLVEKLEEVYANFLEENHVKSEKVCEKRLRDRYEEISKTNYAVSGGYKKYEADMQKLLDWYNQQPHLEEVAVRVLSKFMKAEEQTRQSIVIADNRLTEAEQFQIKLKAEEEARKLAEKAKMEEEKKRKLMEEELEKSKKEHEKRLAAKAEEERKIKEPGFFGKLAQLAWGFLGY